jgi:hypothetical protein
MAVVRKAYPTAWPSDSSNSNFSLKDCSISSKAGFAALGFTHGQIDAFFMAASKIEVDMRLIRFATDLDTRKRNLSIRLVAGGGGKSNSFNDLRFTLLASAPFESVPMIKTVCFRVARMSR